MRWVQGSGLIKVGGFSGFGGGPGLRGLIRSLGLESRRSARVWRVSEGLRKLRAIIQFDLCWESGKENEIKPQTLNLHLEV